MESINITSNRPLVSVQDMVNFIKKGEQYKQLMASNNNEVEIEIMDYLYAVILSPDYQRDYKSTRTEESLIIESLLVGIPIPEVFLVKTQGDIQLRHVMDGQHRLNAIYRYVNNDFSLSGLEILDVDKHGQQIDNPIYIGKKFSELNQLDRIKILGSHISVLEFNPFDNTDLEIELFKRYNRNSKPLESHEIAMATYFSRTSQVISKLLSNIFNESISNEDENEFGYNLYEYKKFGKIYNITKNRKQNQKNHQEICIILNIIENGPSNKENDGPAISSDFMKEKSQLYKTNLEDVNSTLKLFKEFNNWIFELGDIINYPFSTEIFNPGSKRMPKYHVGISIVLSIIFYTFKIDIHNNKMIDELVVLIKSSPVGDVEYTASTTNTKNILKYLFVKNKVQDIPMESFKPDLDRIFKILEDLK